MNLILFDDNDRLDTQRMHLRDPVRLRHLRDIHRAVPGDELSVGLVGGALGRGRLQSLDDTGAIFTVTLDRDPPAPLPVHLLLALPRPRMLARTLEHVTALGGETAYPAAYPARRKKATGSRRNLLPKRSTIT